MISIPPHVLEVLSQCLLVANTPSFVLRKFSESLTIQSLSEAASVGDLRDALETELCARPFTFDRAVMSYALLVALLLKSPSDAATMGSLEGFSQLVFGPSLLALRSPRSFTTHVDRPAILGNVQSQSEPASTLIIPGA